MRFEGLIFDAGDVLFDASVWRKWLTDALRAIGIEVSYEELVAKWENLLVDVYIGKRDYWERFGQLLSSFGLSKEEAEKLAEAAKEKSKEVQIGREVFDGVIETLEKLKQANVKMAVLSDTESGENKIRCMLSSLGIEKYFDAVITSSDTGYVKPQKQAYKVAAEALETEPSLCGFVGHDESELLGAKKAGLFTIAFNCDCSKQADIRIEHFAGLFDVVVK